MTKFSTTKFHNFWRSTTFILVVSPSEVVYKIWISHLRNSNVVNVDKMISNEKVVNYKVSKLIKIYNFYFDHLFIRDYGSSIVYKSYISLLYFMKQQERYVNFVNSVATTISDEQMTKIKVVHLDEFYNFYVHDLFSWSHLIFQNHDWSCHFLKFKIQIDKTRSHEKMNIIIAVITQ
jgi:hypothetical protein